MKIHHSQGIAVRVYINDETAFIFPPELQKDFTVIDNGQAIGVTTAFLTLEGKEQTQATWYFSNKKRYPQYRTIIEGLTHCDVPDFVGFVNGVKK